MFSQEYGLSNRSYYISSGDLNGDAAPDVVVANNWGNKSKELVDRVTQLREAAAAARVPVQALLLFDGDLTPEALQLFRAGVAHDEVWTVDAMLAQLRRVQLR